MKHSYVFLALTFLVSMASTKAFAYDCEVDGIYYDLTGNEAHVTYYSYTYYQNEKAYVGEIIIPETIRYNAKVYTVTSIKNKAFSYCKNLTSIVLNQYLVNYTFNRLKINELH